MAKLLLKTMLLLCTLIAGSGTIWGQSTTYTTGSSISWSHSNGVVIGGTTYNACKIAKGSNTIITIPAGTTKLFVHCAAWNGESHNLSVSSTTTGVSITPTSWSITADSTAHRQPVTIGRTFGNRVTISSGLTSGQHIVVEGYQKLSEGTKVIF